MVKKLQQMAQKQAAGASGLFDSLDTAKLAGSVKDSAQQIWLAGMGAFAKAQAEGGKAFESLIKEGLNLQRKTQTVAEAKLSEVSGKMTGMASEVQARAGQQWDKLENIFEERTAKALRKLGVPSAQDLAALSARVDQLSAQLAKAGKAAPAKRVPVKASAKRAARKAV
jgi:poly(hydroxyalkanoate) granule-associated protein